METFNGRSVVFGLSMYKQLGFYQLLDPTGLRVYGYHVCSTIMKMFLLIIQVIVVFGVLGFFVEIEDTEIKKSNSFELIVILTNCTLSSLKIYTLVTNADVIWDLFNMACEDFLQCSRYSERITRDLVKSWEWSTTITNLIARSFVAGMFLWILGPFIAREDHSKESTDSRRYQNIINVKFPVPTEFYNEYYFAFYSMEVAIGFCIVYGSVLADAFLMSFCWIISAQYQAVTTAYETFGHDNEPESPDKQNSIEIYDFKSIILDNQNVYLKMKSFYGVVRPITLIHVFAYSCSLIMYTYIIVMIFYSDEFIFTEIMKLIMTVSNVTIEVFIFCYLFELVDVKKEAVNFGLYSCNWTARNVKFQKLLIMSMKMNNANRLKLKATANITIDRQFFANVIHTCFKIVSVLLQTQKS